MTRYWQYWCAYYNCGKIYKCCEIKTQNSNVNIIRRGICKNHRNPVNIETERKIVKRKRMERNNE
jgi:hypothetical protein